MSAAFVDDFNRANTTASPTGLGELSGNPGVAWEALRGDWRISSNRADTTMARSSNPIAVIDAAVANVDVAVDVSTGGGDCLYFRVVDANNWWRVRTRFYSTSTVNVGAWSSYSWVVTGGCDEGLFDYVSGYATRQVAACDQDGSNWISYQRTRSVWTSTNYFGQIILERCVAGTITQAATSSTSSSKLRANVSGDSIIVYRWTGSAWSSIITHTNVTHQAATKHGIGRGSSELNGSAIDNFSLSLLIPAAPVAPTLNSPTAGAVFNRTVAQTFSWSFDAQGTGDTQSAYELRARAQGTETWTVGVGAEVPSQTHVFAGGTFAAGVWEWQARTKGQGGEWGAWSASETATAVDPPAGPTITSPANDATIGQAEQLVEWSAAAQDAFRIRTVADAAGSPDTATVYTDTGTVEQAATRARLVAFPVNGRTEHIQLQVRVGGLWSPWSSIRNPVSYTPPAIPEVELFADAGSGTITVQPTFPPPGVGVPAVESWDVLVRVSPGGRADLERPVGGAGIRIAAMLPASQLSFVDRAVASGPDYQYQVIARASNGTATASLWTASALDAGFYGGDYT